jgi:hypothetical protein
MHNSNSWHIEMYLDRLNKKLREKYEKNVEDEPRKKMQIINTKTIKSVDNHGF